jgi:CheY-like chemotaxis protein
MNSAAGAGAVKLAVPRKILIVDDHVDSADIMAEALEMRGHHVRVAYNPLVALALAPEFEPQVALLDVKLPTMDGYELGSALRTQLPECRLIALTGNATGLNYLRSQWAGFHGFLTKPIALEDLLIAVAESRPSGTFPRSSKVDALLWQSPRAQKRERDWIDLDRSPEVVRYWTTALCCTEAQLRAAVAEVGVESEAVRRRLKR